MGELTVSSRMSSALVIQQFGWPLAVAIAATVVLVTTVAAFAVRRLWLMRLSGSFDCYLKTAAGRWSPGVARYSTDALTWYRIFAVGTTGTQFSRRSLRVTAIGPPEGSDAVSLLGGAVVVHCVLAGQPLILGMSREASMGLSSWLESIPPGTSPEIT